MGIGSSLDGTTGPHTSMVVSQILDTCLQQLQISWNPYENWQSGVIAYDISQILTMEVSIASVDSNTTNFDINNVLDGQTYSIYIRARENGVVNEAVSNIVSTTISVNNPISFNYINSVSVVNDGQIDVEVEWDYISDLAQADLLRVRTLPC